MTRKFQLLTWDIEEERICSERFWYESVAIDTAETLSRRWEHPHDVICLLKSRGAGHRWDLAVWDEDKPQKMEYISFYSKKDANFAIKHIKKYDSTIKTKLIKIY